MKQIVATVKPFRAQAVLEAINEFEIDTVLVSEAKGYGRQKDRLPEYRGSEYNSVYLPKIEITALVQDDMADTVVDRIVEVARTGRIGDGKVFVFSLLADFEIDVPGAPPADGTNEMPTA
jgi:nitrogen regulatory protein PII